MVYGALAVGAQTVVFSATWSDNLKLWHHTVCLDRFNARAYNLMGVALLNRQYYEKAVEYLDRAIQLSPRLYTAYQNRAQALAGLGEYEKAAADVSKGLTLENVTETDQAKMRIARGQFSENLGQIDRAIQNYSAVIDNQRIDTVWHLMALKSRSRLYVVQGNLAAGAADLQAILKREEISSEARSAAQTILNTLERASGE
jgi:tetratricopeptide (TPR) repeat protein